MTEKFGNGVTVRRLSDLVYVINGKVICFNHPGMFDMEDPMDVDGLACLADKLYTEGFWLSRLYGERTVCVFFWADRGHEEVGYDVASVDCVREPERSIVRKELGLDG